MEPTHVQLMEIEVRPLLFLRPSGLSSRCACRKTSCNVVMQRQPNLARIPRRAHWQREPLDDVLIYPVFWNFFEIVLI